MVKIHSIVDYNCSNEIVHEQLALNMAYEYLEELKGVKKAKVSNNER